MLAINAAGATHRLKAPFTAESLALCLYGMVEQVGPGQRRGQACAIGLLGL